MIPVLRTRWTRKELTLILAMVTFICAVVFLSVSLARPKPSVSAELGAEWQCRTSLFLTSCTRPPHTETVVDDPLKNPICLRRA
jgi:hypothetical protein